MFIVEKRGRRFSNLVRIRSISLNVAIQKNYSGESDQISLNDMCIEIRKLETGYIFKTPLLEQNCNHKYRNRSLTVL